MLCGADLRAASPAASHSAADADSSTSRTVVKLLIAGLVIAAIAVGGSLVRGLFEDEQTDERPSWEQWGIQPPDDVPSTEKGEFRGSPERPTTGSDAESSQDVVRQLIELGFDEAEARGLTDELGLEAARELVNDETASGSDRRGG